jgi:arsenate reductase (glutaredoxin)
MITLYGIPNCDTVKKARRWLDEQGLAYTFHDFKKQGVPQARLDRWMDTVGAARLVNRQGTTWRKLDAAAQAAAASDDGARALMLAQPSVIKRPVVEAGDRVLVGFDESAYATLKN